MGADSQKEVGSHMMYSSSQAQGHFATKIMPQKALRRAA